MERAHGTHQDRLVKKLRLAGIATYDQANAYLVGHSAGCGRNRLSRDTTQGAATRRVFWPEEERMVSEHWVVRYRNRLLQLERQRQQGAPVKSRVLVRENQAGDLAILYRGQRLAFRELRPTSTALSGASGACPFPRAHP